MNRISYQILNYLKENGDSTAIDIGRKINIQKRLVDAYFSAEIMNAGLGIRDYTTSPSMLRLNNESKNYIQ